MDTTFDPLTIRDQFVRAYRAMNRAQPAYNPPAYNPMDETLFSQFSTQSHPTASVPLEIIRGILSAYVGRKIGQSKLDYAEAERQRLRDEAQADFDRRRRAEFQDRAGLAGIEHGMKVAEDLRDPTKFVQPTAGQVANMETVSRLFGTNPEFQRAASADPSFPARAIRSTMAANPELGLFGAVPFQKPIEVNKNSVIWDPMKGQWITPPCSGPTIDYKDRTRHLADGKEQFEVSYDGGKSWKAVGEPAPRWQQRSDADTPGAGIDLSTQKEINDLVTQFLTVTTPEYGTGSLIKEVPAELRATGLAVAARATGLLDRGEAMTVPEAVAVAIDDFKKANLIPMGPTDRPFPEEVVFPKPGPSAGTGTTGSVSSTGVQLTKPAGTGTRAPAVTAPLAPPPAAPGSFFRPARPDLGIGHGGQPIVGSPKADKGRFFQDANPLADPLVQGRQIGPDLWEYTVSGRTYQIQGTGGTPMRRSTLTGEPYTPAAKVSH